MIAASELAGEVGVNCESEPLKAVLSRNFFKKLTHNSLVFSLEISLEVFELPASCASSSLTQATNEQLSVEKGDFLKVAFLPIVAQWS